MSRWKSYWWKNGEARGVRTSKRTLHADSVVVNADFAEAMRKLLPGKHRRRWTDDRIASKRFLLLDVHGVSRH